MGVEQADIGAGGQSASMHAAWCVVDRGKRVEQKTKGCALCGESPDGSGQRLEEG